MSHERPAGLRLAELKEAGIDVVPIWGDDYHLTVDLDGDKAVSEFEKRWNALQERVPGLFLIDRWTSRSGNGQHVYIGSEKRLGFQTRATLQAFLGSDPLREMLGWFDVNNCGEEDPFVLFQPKPAEKRDPLTGRMQRKPKYDGSF